MAEMPLVKSHYDAVTSETELNVVLADFIQLFNDLRLHHKDVETIRRRACNEGLAFLTFGLHKLCTALLDGVRTGSFLCPLGFSSNHRSALPRFLGGCFAAIFHDDGNIRVDASAKAFKSIYQVCTFYKKCEFDKTDDALATRVVDSFLHTEFELQDKLLTLTNSDEKRSLLRHASQLLGIVFKGFDPQDIRCKDGPGAVSDHSVRPAPRPEYTLWWFGAKAILLPGFHVYGIPKYEKRLAASSVVEEFFSHFWYNENDLLHSSHRLPKKAHFDVFQDQEHARVVLVPKDLRGPRLISCEPREKQWVQQGLMGFMVEKLETSPLTKGLVNFTTQEINQNLALAASSGEVAYATLDLKDASDRVTWPLVVHLFDDAPALLSALRHVRSAYTLVDKTYTSTRWNRWVLDKHRNLVEKKFHFSETNIDGKEYYKVPLAKHAPMGSATCFPVMASCIWALLTAHLCRKYGVQIGAKAVFVFGDDILVPQQLAAECASVLESFLLKVNDSKSFSSGPFRESCGTDAFKGIDVTPLKIRSFLPCGKIQKKNTTQTNQLVSLLATAHLASQAGYTLLAERLYRRVESGLGSSLPYGFSSSPFLCRWQKDGLNDSCSYLNKTMGELGLLKSYQKTTKRLIKHTVLGFPELFEWQLQIRTSPFEFQGWQICSVEDEVAETPYGYLYRRSVNKPALLSSYIKGLLEFSPVRYGEATRKDNIVLRKIRVGESMQRLLRPAHA